MSDLSFKKILIVDDEMPVLNLLKDKLMAKNFNVLTATDGKVGLDLALKNLPDLILLDIVMPRMDGLTMLKNLRANRKVAETPVILLTNLTESTMVLDAKDNGAENYFIKSDVKLDDVIDQVTERMYRGVIN